MVNAVMHTKLVIGSAFADSSDSIGHVTSHSDLPKSVAIFRNDRNARLQKEIENPTAGKRFFAEHVVAADKLIAVRRMKTFDQAEAEARKLVSDYNKTTTVPQEIVLTSELPYNFARFEVRKQIPDIMRNTNEKLVMTERKN